MQIASNQTSTSPTGAKGDCEHPQSFTAGPLPSKTLKPGTLELHCRQEERRNKNNLNYSNYNLNLFTSACGLLAASTCSSTRSGLRRGRLRDAALLTAQQHGRDLKRDHNSQSGTSFFELS